MSRLTAAGPHDEVSIYFQRRKLITLFDRGGRRSLRERSLPAVEALNEMVRAGHGARVSASPGPQGRFAVGVPGRPPVLEVLPGDLQDREDAATVALEWAASLNYSMDHYVYRN
jgi:hypothetical protein